MSEEKEFIAPEISVQNGEVIWEAPSNIALVKYWGKYGTQLPCNPSISFTLSACKTTTKVLYSPRTKMDSPFSFDFLFEGKPAPSFHPKIASFLTKITPFCPYVKTHHFSIQSQNSFPHSSGIASSAASMAALALCLLSIERQARPTIDSASVFKKASFLARLGSGSAARSVEGPVVSWGVSNSVEGSSLLFGTRMRENLHPVFHDYQDTILIIDKGQKQVSSTLGHQLMEKHPYADVRFKQAEDHFGQLYTVMQSGDLDAFVPLVEKEALTLHALMMASDPYFILMQPNTLAVIQKVWAFRVETKIPLCFTLDAGANVHLLFPKSDAQKVKAFIQEELIHYCQNNHYIEDQVGNGPKKQ